MTVRNHCRRPASTIRPEETLLRAAERMAGERVGTLVVTDDGRPVGMVTDRDVALGVVADGLGADVTRVARLAAAPPVTAPEHLPLGEASARMRGHGVRRMPVVDAQGRVVGVLAADDLVRLVAQELTALADVAAEQVPLSVRPIGAASREVEHYAKDVVVVTPETPVDELARRMRDAGVGCVVVALDDVPRGVVTDRDLVVRVVAKGLDPSATRASAVMSAPVVTADARDPIPEVARVMSAHAVRRIPVTRDGRLWGIVTYDDLVAMLGAELRNLGEGARGAIARERQGTLPR